MWAAIDITEKVIVKRPHDDNWEWPALTAAVDPGQAKPLGTAPLNGAGRTDGKQVDLASRHIAADPLSPPHSFQSEGIDRSSRQPK